MLTALRLDAPFSPRSTAARQLLAPTRVLTPTADLDLAWPPYADQDQLPMLGLDPRSSFSARPGAVHGPGTTCRNERNPGVAVFLLQESLSMRLPYIQSMTYSYNRQSSRTHLDG